MSVCEEVLPLVAFRRLGVLEEAEQARLEEHLASCPSCPATAARLEGALDAAHAKPVAARPDGWARIEAELAEARTPSARLTPSGAIPVVLSCTFCHGSLGREGKVHCSACLAPYHADCFAEHGRCAIAGCAETRFVEARGVEDSPRKFRKPWPAVLGVVLLGGLTAAAVRLGSAPDGRRGSFPEPARVLDYSPLVYKVPPTPVAVAPSPSPTPTPTPSPAEDPDKGFVTVFDGHESQLANFTREHLWTWRVVNGLLFADNIEQDLTEQASYASAIWLDNGAGGWRDFDMALEFRVVKGTLSVLVRAGKDELDKPVRGKGAAVHFTTASVGASWWRAARIHVSGSSVTASIDGHDFFGGDPLQVAELEGLIGLSTDPGSQVEVRRLEVRFRDAHARPFRVAAEPDPDVVRAKAYPAKKTRRNERVNALRAERFAAVKEQLELSNNGFEWQVRSEVPEGLHPFAFSKQRLTITNPGTEPIYFGKNKRSWSAFSLRFRVRFERGTEASLLGRIHGNEREAFTWDELPLTAPAGAPGSTQLFEGIPASGRDWTAATVEFRMLDDRWDVIVDGQAPREVHLLKSSKNRQGGFGFLVRKGQIEVEDLYARVVSNLIGDRVLTPGDDGE